MMKLKKIYEKLMQIVTISNIRETLHSIFSNVTKKHKLCSALVTLLRNYAAIFVPNADIAKRAKLKVMQFYLK